MKTKNDIKNKSVAELNTELEALLKTGFSLRLQRSLQQLTKNSEFKRVRRDIARIKTILRQKEMQA